jgi:hypothetical protein
VRVTAVSPGDADPEGSDFEHALLVDHARYGCLSLWCKTTERSYPFVFRPRAYKGIPYAQLVYCRSLDQLIRACGTIGRFLIARGLPLVAVDADGPIRGLVGKYFDLRATRYFRGPDRPRLGDLAYTETAMFGV